MNIESMNESFQKAVKDKRAIYQIVRDKNRNPIGVAVAINLDVNPLISYSRCNPQDKFCVKTGIAIAYSRAIVNYYKRRKNSQQFIENKRNSTFLNFIHNQFLTRSKIYFQKDFIGIISDNVFQE